MIKSIRIEEINYPGVTKITSDEWDGHVLRMSHSTCCKWIASTGTPQQAGVYLLYADHFDRVTHGNRLYIGQTGAIGQRIGQHIGKKEFWTAVLVFTSVGDWMNVAYTPNIEQQFIKWAKQANRYELDNEDDGRKEHLGQDDQARLQSFLAGVQPVLRLAGIDVFEPNLDGIFSYAGYRGAPTSDLKIACGQPSPAVIILAGSQIERLDEAMVNQANLSDVSYDADKCIHTFNISVTVSLNMVGTIPRLFNSPLTHWKSKSGVSISKTLGV